jgi:hypothetical protein
MLLERDFTSSVPRDLREVAQLFTYTLPSWAYFLFASLHAGGATNG